MPSRPRLRAAGRTALGLLPGAVRSRALRVAGGHLGLAGAEVGLVSVVVVVEPGDRVEECLASVRGQSHGLTEVVVCPVGDAVTSLPDDPRFRARPPVATSYAAVNAGVDASAGDHVILVRGCDRLQPDALTVLAGSLAVSGADLASGLLEQVGEPEPWLARAQADSHPGPARAVPAGPDQAADLTVANKAFSRAFARRLRLTALDDWLCSPALAHLLTEATLDVVDRPVVLLAHDRGRRAYGARPSPLPTLGDWVGRRDLVAGAVAGTPLAEGWRRHWYDVLATRFLTDAERADDATWRRLVELAEVPDDPGLRASSRALVALAREGRRHDVETLAEELEGLGDDVRTELTEGGLLAQWSSVDLPGPLRLLAPSETRLRTHVVRVVDVPEGRDADLYVRIEGLDLGRHRLEVTADVDGRPLAVVAGVDHAADRWADARFQSAAEGAVRVRLPAGSRRLRLRATCGPLRREAVLEVPQPLATAAGSCATVLAVDLDGDRLVVHLDEPAERVRLRGPGVDVAAEPRRDGTATVGLRRDLWGRPVGLATGRYHLARPDGLAVSAAWRARLPVETVGETHRLRVVHGSGAGDLLLGPPRADDELGAYGQERLRAAYAVDPRPTDPGLWYLESFAGRSATDSPLAIFEEARRRLPGLRAAWGILDHGHWVPPGATPVVIGSRGWYDVLATARCVVTTTELEEWYRRRPDQLVVQCFHGYPSKAMGESQWRARELPPSRVRAMRRRSVETWDLISTPTPEMTAVYREQYGYTGPAAEHGYPRDDVLRSPEADRIRADTRRRLGVAPDQTAVLYAPTWRDHLASRPRAAAMTEHLDVDAAAASLGDSHVILLRGHRFHTPSRSRTGVVDVTDHPEVNDLVLASDVAVLDYSSLRFDYAQTGRPMVFLVPDLGDYTTGVRGFLLPFEETAPGPLVRTTDEVVAHVADVASLTATWAGRVRDFDARFNPWQDGRAASRLVDTLTELLTAADDGPAHEVG